MPGLDISDLTRAYIAQVTGGLCADIVQLKAEIALLRAENSRLNQQRAGQPEPHAGEAGTDAP